MLDRDRLLARLNPPQRDAVTHGDGPLLILAGAGSGKTRVITCRIAWLVGAHGVAPRDVVAVTFTNKAASEMRERAEGLLSHELTGAYVGTFHAFGLRILRTHALAAGLPPGFVVYDTTDQLAIARQVLRGLGVDEKQFTPRQLLTAISRAKNAYVGPAELRTQANVADPHLAELLADAYGQYEAALHRAGAVDFDDLLVGPVRLFEARPDVHERLADRVRFLLVDEYQDTNPLQYRLIRQLTSRHRNVCCVGDEDQSIYAFRGADIRNILDFERDFPDARVVKLEQNYRSTGTILAAASAVIKNNLNRHDKGLWTSGEKGEALRVHVAHDDRSEADFIVAEILRRAREHHVPLEQIGVLYRTNAVSRLIEDRLMANRVPYRVVGSLRFYDRKEIKDLLAWLRLLVQPDSDQDFLRAAGTPPRGIGDKTLEDLAARAAAAGISLHRAAQEALPELPQRSRSALTGFLEMIRDLTDLAQSIGTAAALQTTVDLIDYRSYLERSHPGDVVTRTENIGALLAAAREHDEAGAPEGLAGFLDRVSLRSDTDDVKGQRGPSLMTVHAAKGLEFDAVFVAGLNENLFPHALSSDDHDAIEEERRLLYVALTRARKHLVLTLARERRPFGRLQAYQPSRFLQELPAELVRESGGGVAHATFADRGGAPGYASVAARGSAWRREPGMRPWEQGTEDAPRAPRTPPAGVRAPAAQGRRVEREDDADDFRAGMRVHHPTYGRGRVLVVEGTGTGTRLKVRFESGHLGKFVAAHCPLEIE